MRIAFLSVSAEFGGSESAMWQLVRGLRRLSPSNEAIVVVPREGALSARVRETGAEVRVLSMPDALASFGEWSLKGATAVARRSTALLAALRTVPAYREALRALLSALAPDVVHSNGFKMHVLGARSAPAGVPVVWHMHEYLSNRPLSRALLRHHAPRAAAIVANSRSVADDVAGALGSAASRVTSVHNAVDLAEFSPAGPVDDLDALAGLSPAPERTLRVGLVATFARWKGHETFLRAMRATRELPVRGYVLGGPLYDTAGSQYSLEELRSLAASLGVADRVGLTGHRAHPAAAMRALDVVVHASTEPEPFGLVIAEAMACGRPVLVSAAGGAAELVQHEQNALTFPPGDVDALACAIARCASDEILRARIGAAARRTAVTRFDPDVFTQAFLDIYTRAARRDSAVTA
jgi:glycosyltransferase involved in cell wall biosynthesis